jgi:hypothetical protein
MPVFILRKIHEKLFFNFSFFLATQKIPQKHPFLASPHHLDGGKIGGINPRKRVLIPFLLPPTSKTKYSHK